MQRPRAKQSKAHPDLGSRYLIMDGYVDEPAALGVPPFISPHIRSLAGGLVAGGADGREIGYLTIDQWRDLRGGGWSIGSMTKLEIVILVAGCVVPGRYLRGTPVSPREAEELRSSLKGPDMMICGPASRSFSETGDVADSGDLGVLGESIASTGTPSSRDRTPEEWNDHLEMGSFIIRKHPDFPSPLIVEIETSRGCPRYISGGCSFCVEPKKGPLQFRRPEDVVREVEALSAHGAENLRIGGQSDLISYGSPDIGRCEVPEPSPEMVRELMSGIHHALYHGEGSSSAEVSGRRLGVDRGIIHTDNANPAVIAEYPDQAGEVLKTIVECTTSGNVLALGLESSDPVVKESNNLNSTPEQALEAIRMMARIGGERGENGLPRLLPGLNFLGGLPGQTPKSFEMDLRFLQDVLSEGLRLRRVNIRAAVFEDVNGRMRDHVDRMGLGPSFRSFKERVRKDIDIRFMERLLPKGTLMKGVNVETSLGHVSFGRQIGSYPVLVGMEHTVRVGEVLDVAVSEVSGRSVTGFRSPFPINEASFRDLSALPGVGKKRAATIFRERPVRSEHIAWMFRENEWVVPHIKV